ncbi:16225_t:CDS:1, partial [Acaulospora colombiana]
PNEMHVHDMIQSLAVLSLVQTSMVNNTILLRFHPLVHSWAHEMVLPNSLAIYKQMAITIVSTSTAALSQEHFQYLPAHIIRSMDKVDLRDLHARDMVSFGSIMSDYGFGRAAVELHEEAVKKIEAGAGENDKQTADGYDFLGTTYCQVGKLKEAEEMQIKVMKMRQEILGECHADTIGASNNLALTYRHLGKRKEAEELQIKVMEMWQEILGERHPDTIGASSNLALTYQGLGKFKEAEELQIK